MSPPPIIITTDEKLFLLSFYFFRSQKSTARPYLVRSYLGDTLDFVRDIMYSIITAQKAQRMLKQIFLKE
ncbi:MAG TPA: hypothetical protein DEF14_02165 [Ruminococcaceae bacterium]|nr:hypothetical protein [Oscillospiraceae bacterium]